MSTTFEPVSRVGQQAEQHFAPVFATGEAFSPQADMVIALAHDLGDSLSIINVAYSLFAPLVQHLPQTEQAMAHTLLSNIETNIAQMKRLLVAMQESVNPPLAKPQHHTSNIVDIVRYVVAEQIPRAHPDQIRFETDTASIIGMWKPLDIERIVGNLLANAIKYSRDASPITVALTCVRELDMAWVELAVSDHGIGILRRDLPYVFEDGYRGSNVTDDIGGSGHGLAIVRKLVEDYGGEAEVTSVEDVGSVFTVRLPIGTQALE